MSDKRFRITWHDRDGGWYGVSIPNYDGGEVVPAEVFDRERERSKALAEALRIALDHVLELEDAWVRGCISEHDGKGGTRSNRNTAVRVQAIEALREWEQMEIQA